LLTETISQVVSQRFTLRQANASGAKKLINLDNAIAQFLNLALKLGALFFVVESKLAKLVLEMLGAFFFVLEVKLEELALEMRDPRNLFRNESI
jgi:hypothetical protein